MTRFSDTDAAADFIATADSRRTSPEVMKAITFFAKDAADAEAIWEGDGGDAQLLSGICEFATGNGRIDGEDLFWGDRPLTDITAN